MNEEQDPAVEVADEAAHRHLKDDVQALMSDGVAYARTEFAFQKARVGFATSRVKSIAVLGAGALVLLFFALMALTVGLVFTLAQVIAPIWATLLVFGVLAALAALCGVLAGKRWGAMVAVLSDRKKP